ncbi:hypothetical protein FG167_06025 [Lacinutrix sp. WUR7]|uniref:hypothetical protein n=1 Tax=Lacinutrix sp. WUR7 TaxID=2653681 RepID=UPI00193E14F5|nr:hypothetical protein [Lacinutrix sp. WUR7]QRM88808.1 hypothetical protein FG167_06025 [Lacinutrix sp. WUR7]
MKKLIKNTLAIIVLFTALLANANAPLSDLKNAKRTTLTLNDVKKGDKLLIKNTQGIILYNESIQNSGDYTKGFDLTELPNGDYFFELNKAIKIVIIPFHVSNNIVIFKKEKELTIFKPYIRNKKNKIYITKLSLDQKPLDIKVYYEDLNGDDFNLIYSETINNDAKNIGRILSLDEKLKGTYKIVTKTEGRTFIDYIQF